MSNQLPSTPPIWIRVITTTHIIFVLPVRFVKKLSNNEQYVNVYKATERYSNFKKTWEKDKQEKELNTDAVEALDFHIKCIDTFYSRMCKIPIDKLEESTVHKLTHGVYYNSSCLISAACHIDKELDKMDKIKQKVMENRVIENHD